MLNRNNTAQSFWQSKLGHAALASIAAMVLMIALTTQIIPATASSGASGAGHVLLGAAVSLEIA
jgi:hypothetical protein